MFNFNLLEMLPEELSIAASNALHKSVKKEKASTVKNIKFKRSGTTYSVNIYVKPFLQDDNAAQNVFLLLFTEDNENNKVEKDIEGFDMEAQTKRYLENLEAELASTKQKLKETNDALEASQDNISSYNEELISSNEELQSTNEELQSVNEELQTVNNEYQLKIKELAELNDDLNNYFKSTINAQLYVDKNLILRKYTPSAIQQVNVRESDVGRKLSDISTNIRFSTLMDDINTVISSSTKIEKEIQTVDGKWYQMIAMPYVKQRNNENDGAIITFNDISELKRSQDKLSRINADHDTFIYAVSHDLKGPLRNLEKLISLLKDSVDPHNDKAKEVLGMIDKSIANLTEVITDLSNITKIEHEIHEYENINIKDLLREVQLSMKDLLVQSGAKINVDLREPEIPFSKKNLRSILSNLLSNALKYRSPDRTPEITISTADSDECIILTVQDNGAGIKGNTNEIFSKFKRGQSKEIEGSGIGLYLIKKMITNAGGDIEVESEPGKGTVFTVYFKKQ
jgi:two-component system CheB/CheR fusion protein